ncbi:hypothetical protein WCWAEYFT_CDS0199 [Vibrio phage VB_VaC_TDDLMA]
MKFTEYLNEGRINEKSSAFKFTDPDSKDKFSIAIDDDTALIRYNDEVMYIEGKKFVELKKLFK